MPDSPISGLPASVFVEPTDLLAIVQGGITKKADADLVGGPRTQETLVRGVAATSIEFVQDAELETELVNTTGTGGGAGLSIGGSDVLVDSLEIHVPEGGTYLVMATLYFLLDSGGDTGHRWQVIWYATFSGGPGPFTPPEFVDYTNGGQQSRNASWFFVLTLDAGDYTLELHATATLPGTATANVTADNLIIVKQPTLNNTLAEAVTVVTPATRSITVFASLFLLEDGTPILLEDGSFLFEE